jgi:glycosyltransferase involved in cell wall biosynthesis
MRVTVAICTWNRAKLLDQTLRHMHDLKVPEGGEWELLVVDNNSTDETPAVVARHSAALPIRYLFEPKPGQSNARNCAIKAASGELLVWTDDDVLVDREWLAAYVAAARRWPDAAYFGGYISPVFEVQPPRWIVDNLDIVGHALVARDLGPDERKLKAGETVFGASMAFRQSKVAGLEFDPRVGLVGHDNVRGDEAAFIAQVLARGGYGVWVPTARLQHFTPRSRMTARFFWNWFDGAGRHSIRVRNAPLVGRSLFGVPRWMLRQYAQSRLVAAVCSVRRGRRWLLALRTAAVTHGMIAELRSGVAAE